MSDFDDWLPVIITMADCNHHWNEYCELIYKTFHKDFILSSPNFCGRKVAVRRYPTERDKEWAFWHLTQEGEVEADRLPNFRRCERLNWIARVINAVGKRQELKIWKQHRNGSKNLVIALGDMSYKIILAERSPTKGQPYLLLLTAFPVEEEHSRRKMMREWEANKITFES
jgi:hypothetical protein